MWISFSLPQPNIGPKFAGYLPVSAATLNVTTRHQVLDLSPACSTDSEIKQPSPHGVIMGSRRGNKSTRKQPIASAGNSPDHGKHPKKAPRHVCGEGGVGDVVTKQNPFRKQPEPIRKQNGNFEKQGMGL
jgi:hypothetical protein